MWRQQRPRRLMLVGSVLADLRMMVDKLPERGGDAFAGRTELESGGGFNVLIAAVRNGLPAVLAGRHGTGPFGDRVRRDLDAAGIPVLLPSGERDTGFSITMIEPDGERTFVTSPGAESVITAELLGGITPAPGDAVYISGYDLCYPRTGPAFAGWLPTVPAETLLVFDPGPLADRIPPSVATTVLARTDILTLNRRETGLLTGTTDPNEAAPALAAQTRDGALIVMRRGAEGSAVAGRHGAAGGTVAGRHGAAGGTVAEGAEGGAVAEPEQEPVIIPAPYVDPIDTTGAGDAHTGILLASLAAGLEPLAAVRRAGVGAAISTTVNGSATAPDATLIDRHIAGADRHVAESGRGR